MARVTLPRKLIIRLISSYCIITVLGAGVALWLHTEKDGLLAKQAQQQLQNEGESVVVASPSYELIMSMDSNTLKESHLKDRLMQMISGKALTIVAMEEEETKQGSQLNVEVSGTLQDYFTFTEELSEAYPKFVIEPQQLKKDNGQLHILFSIKG
ncbi:Uncharacterised protein [Veillonella criceti]|uniref:Uncharacterized protein n=1 Tax=Veillonella criceti TaxID=103891 RepID=A0A380NIG3_9FIRM|nr:Uncharacterised protein [Veillonella criceti]